MPMAVVPILMAYEAAEGGKRWAQGGGCRAIGDSPHNLLRSVSLADEGGAEDGLEGELEALILVGAG
jgi:hypothetical protein